MSLSTPMQFDILNEFQFMWASRSVTSMVPDGRSEKTQKHFFNQECRFLHDRIQSRFFVFRIYITRNATKMRIWRNASITMTSISLYVFHLTANSWAMYSYWRYPRIAYRIVSADMCKRPCDFSFGNTCSEWKCTRLRTHARGTKKARWQAVIHFVHLTKLGNEEHT